MQNCSKDNADLKLDNNSIPKDIQRILITNYKIQEVTMNF